MSIRPSVPCKQFSFVCFSTFVRHMQLIILFQRVFTWSKSLWMCVSVSVTGRLRNRAKSSRDSRSPCCFRALRASSSSCFSEVSALNLMKHGNTTLSYVTKLELFLLQLQLVTFTHVSFFKPPQGGSVPPASDSRPSLTGLPPPLPFNSP